MIGQFWHSLSLRAKGLVVALIPLGALLLSSFMFYLATHEEQRAQEWVNHTLEVRDQIQQAHTSLEESETRLRGYLLSDNHEMLTRSRSALGELSGTVEKLRVLVNDNPTQLARVERLRVLEKRKRIQMDNIVARYPFLVSHDLLGQTVLQNRGVLIAIREELGAMRAEEDRLRLLHTARLEQARFWVGAVVALGVLVGILGGLAASFLFTREIDQRVRQLDLSARALALGQPLPLAASNAANSNAQDTIASLERELGQAGQQLIERQNKLTEANDFLNHLIGSMPGVLVRLDQKFRVLYVSHNAPRIFGYALDEIWADPNFYSRTMHPEDRNHVMVELTRAVLENAPLVETERRVLHADGKYRWMHSYVRPEYDEEGNATGLLSYSVDVTELKHTQEALRESEVLLRNSFDSAPIGIALVTLDGGWLQANRAMCDILGYSEAEFLQTSLRTISHPDDFAESVRRRQQLLDGEVPLHQVETRYIHHSGHVVWIQLNATLVRDDDGAPLYFIAQIQDISERKRIAIELAQARDAALESVRAKANFMAKMSHEIRTPMNGIIGMADLMSNTRLDAKQRDFIFTMRESAEALLVIINDILDFSKIEAGKLEMDVEDFDLNITVEASIGLLAHKAQARGVELGSLVYSDVPTSIRGDAGRLRQILLNLLDNAIKFASSGGEAMLRVTREEEDESHVTLNFAICDSGIGISEASQITLFQPFSQADSSTTRRYGGTGLGLAICKQLVELMGGKIGVRSKVGKGSTFYFTVPFEKQATPTAAPEKVDMSDCRVLIVDNNAAHRRMVQQQVASWKFQSETASTAADAIEMMHREFRVGNPYHIAIISRQLEDMDGLAMVSAIRSHPLIAATRIVCMVPPDENTQVLLAKGADGVLTKPIRQSQLFNCLTEILETGRMANLAPPAIMAAPLPSGDNQRALRLLVAEDNAINQKVVLNQLDNLGHKARVVGNGAEALREWESGAYDMILMDCHMPEMDGYAAAREIRSRETPESHIPIIALTANALDGDRERCLAAGMDDYLSKPVKQDALSGMLERWGEDSDSAAPLGDSAALPSVVQTERLSELQADLPPQLFEELLQMFLEEAPQLLHDLERAWNEDDVCEVGEIAHKFKGSCATLGATRMADLCNQIQDHAQRNALGSVTPLLNHLEDEFHPVRSVLSSYLCHNVKLV